MESLLQIQEKIREFIVKASYAEDGKIDNDTLIFEQGVMDSMGFMSIIGFIEEEFSVTPSGGELTEENFESIDAISNFVERKLQS